MLCRIMILKCFLLSTSQAATENEIDEPVEKNQTHCPAGHLAASIKNGFICYAGAIIESQVYNTTCIKDYQISSLNDSAIVVECQDNSNRTREPSQQGMSINNLSY